jgi:predicted nucleotidyltransferase
MGTKQFNISVGETLFGKTQRMLLALFFTRTDEAFYLRQIVRTAGIGLGTVQRELARWVAAGLLVRAQRGNQVYYQANGVSPVFGELKSLAVKTAGVADVLREALAALSERIAVAFVHGSLAKGTGKADSDVDVLLIGEVDFGEVVSALQSAQNTLRREVNPSVYSAREFRAKCRAKHHFVTSVLNAPKVFLVGGEHELKRLAEGPVADRT